MHIFAFSLGVILSLFLGTYTNGFVRAQSTEVTKLQSEITARNDRLKTIEAEIDQFKKELQKVGAEKGTLQKAIQRLELEYKKISADIKYTENKIGSTDLEISKLNLEVDKTQNSIDKNKDAIADIIRKLNASDEDTLLIALLRTEKISEFWNNVEELEGIKSAMHERVTELASLRS